MAILDDLRREFGLTMLFITHDLELAAAICDRTAVMYAGQIVEIRRSSLLHDDPLHPYTAALAGARPDIAQTAHRLRAIPGRPLSAFEAPQDECAFAPRCPHAQRRLPGGGARSGGDRRRAVPLRAHPRAARQAPGGRGCLRLPRPGLPYRQAPEARGERDGRPERGGPAQGVRPAGRGRRRLVRHPGSRVAGHRRGVGLGQDHHRQDDRRAGAADQRDDHGLRPRPVPARPLGEGQAPARPRGADRVPGPLHQPGPA